MGMLKQSDAEIVQHVLSGNRQIFDELLVRYTKVAYAISYAHLGNPAGVLEAVEKAWVQVFQSLDSLQNANRFGEWFAGIVRSVSINLTKKFIMVQAHANTREIVMHGAKKTDDKDAQQVLWSHIAKHPPGHREILTLHYLAGIAPEEIARITEESPDLVKKRLQRAQSELNELLPAGVFRASEQTEKRLQIRVMSLVRATSAPWLVKQEAGANAATRAASPLNVSINPKTVGIIALLAIVIAAAGWVLLGRDSKSTPSRKYSAPAASNSGYNKPKRDMNDEQRQVVESISKEFKK